MKKFNYLLFFCGVILISCGNNTHEDYHSFHHNGWSSDSIVYFKYTITDTTSRYDLSLNIRHTVNYEFQNLFIFLEEGTRDTIEISLANKRGKWLGLGISDVREFKYTIENQRVFTEKGTYELSVEQAMRYGELHKIERLEHILDVGLIVSKNNE